MLRSSKIERKLKTPTQKFFVSWPCVEETPFPSSVVNLGLGVEWIDTSFTSVPYRDWSFFSLCSEPLCLLVSVGGRRSQHPGPSPTLELLGPSHQRRHKSRVWLRGPPCAHGVSGTPHGEVCDNNTGVEV